MAGGLHFVNTVDNKHAIVSIEQLRSSFKGVQNQAQEAGKSIDSMLGNIAKATGITIGAAGLKDLAAQVMKVRGEFQQLEIAFGTMLGSADKANKLMSQLTKTAASTPFDLQGVASGAKQLLAYGIAAEDVNQTLINLGDIAAGLSIPLNDMVMLYGTTMVQGRMFTQDLRQFTGRGIPLMQALADTMGVAKENVQELVSSGKVGAQEFQTALMSLVAEGGKFGGLMEKQSKSITGQISNIEDGIDMMFNEIGQKSDGIINAALSGVSTLVENYESVGKAVVSLAGSYGIYRTALVVVSSVEKAHNNILHAAIAQKRLAAAANITLSNSDAMAAAQKAMFTRYIKSNTKAILKNTAAMLSNPAVAVTAALVALCATVYAVSRALDTQSRAQEKVNNLNNKQKEQLDDIKQQSEQAISTIKSETSTIYEKAKAYETLKKTMPSLTEQYTLEQIAAMSLSSAQKEVASSLDDMEFSLKEKQIAQTSETIQRLEASMLELSKSGAATGGIKTRIDTEKKVLAELKQEYADMKKMRDQAQFDAQPTEVKVAKFTADKENAEKQLEDLQKQAAEAAEEAKAKWESNPANKWKIGLGITFEQEAGNNQSLLGGNYLMLQPVIKSLQKQIQDTAGQIDSLSANAGKQTLPQLVEDIKAAEMVVENARKTYADNMTDANKKEVSETEETLKNLTEQYKIATGDVWVSTQKMYDEIAKARQQAENEKKRILNSSIQSERAQREAAYWQTIQEINQEEAAYRKSHNGRTSSEFALKRENATIQFDIDTKEFDRQFAEWKRAYEQETARIRIEADTEDVERAIENANNLTEKIRLQNELYERQISLKRQDSKQEADNAVRSRYGDRTQADFLSFYGNDTNKSVLSSYNNAKTQEDKKDVANKAGISEQLLATYAEIEQIYKQYETRLNATIDSAERGHQAEMLRQDIDAYTDYVEQIIELEQWKSEQLQAIRDGESALTAQQIEEVYQQQKGQLQEQNGIDDMDGAAADISANLATALSNATWEEIKRIGEEAMAQLDEQIAALEAQKQSASEELGRQAGTDENGNEVSATGVYAEIAQAEADIAAGKEGAQERLNSLLEREQQLTTQIQTADGNSIKLGKQKKRVQEQVNKATKDGTNQTQKLTKAQKWGVVAESLSTVNDALNVLADTMGGSLSKKSKKAVESLQTVVSFATQNIKGIETLVDVASKGMSATANGAAEAMSAAEKASVILTIISLAVQAIQAIVNIAMKYSESAKMQEAIDAQLERVDKLKRKNEDLQRSYKDSTGVDYYKGMARAAKDYTNIINAQKKALQEAEALYERQRAKYGEDSDKTKEAEQQVEDIQDGLNDLADEQADLLQELRDSLLTTDLTTFSENLADSLIDGFENSKEGIADTWDDMLNDLLTSLLKKQLALQLEKQFESVFNKMNNMADDGVLTQSEIDEIVELMNGASEGAKQIAEAYYDVMDEMGLLSDSDNTGSKGGFEGMSQDTADELNARFTALQITGANIDATVQGMSQQVSEMSAGERIKTTLLQTLQENSLLGVQIAQNQLDQLRIIADNTGMLTETNRRLHAIEQHTSKL